MKLNNFATAESFWKLMPLSRLQTAVLAIFIVLQTSVYTQTISTRNAAAPSANNFAYPQSLFVDSPNGHIWVTDFDHHRVLRFDVSTLSAIKKGEGLTFPHQYYLSQNFPNPFNPVTQIAFSVPRTGFISVNVFNLLGQKVAELFNEVATAQTQYLFSFDAKNLSSGIYWYTLRSTEGIIVKRMCLIK